jgi:hypothetical protein
MCAGISAGFFSDYEDASNKCKVVVSKTEPIKENTEKYSKIFSKYKKISQFIVDLTNEQ